jgi:hypothetical protein
MINRPYSFIFIEEWDWTRYKPISHANPANLANNRSKKLGTLIGSARADRPAPRPDRPVSHFGAQQLQELLRSSFVGNQTSKNSNGAASPTPQPNTP